MIPGECWQPWVKTNLHKFRRNKRFKSSPWTLLRQILAFIHSAVFKAGHLGTFGAIRLPATSEIATFVAHFRVWPEKKEIIARVSISYCLFTPNKGYPLITLLLGSCPQAKPLFLHLPPLLEDLISTFRTKSDQLHLHVNTTSRGWFSAVVRYNIA